MGTDQLHGGSIEAVGSQQRQQPSVMVAPSALEASATAGSHDASSSPTAPQEDDVAPHVLWTSPSDGESGVAAGAEIVIQFSEAMATAAVEAALTSNLPDEFSIRWDAGGSQLRLLPLAPLPYADGASQSKALTFTVAISEGATDQARNTLGGAEFSFSTMQRFQLELAPLEDVALSGGLASLDFGESESDESELEDPTEDEWVDEGPPFASSEEACSRGTAFCVGDSLRSQNRSVQRKVFLTFSLASLPDSVQVESAQLLVKSRQLLGDPFGEQGLGNLHIERTHFSQLGAAPFFADPDATVAVLSAGETEVQSDNISWVVDEARERGLTQYRLTFPQQTNRDDIADLVVFERERQTLYVTYLAP